jgi:hypothetical protein
MKMGRKIQKDELIQLHAFLLQLRTNLENMIENNNPELFFSYEQLNTGPHKIHKSKTEHKLAIFELSKCIANLLKQENSHLFQKICEDLEKMCERFK